MFTAPSLSVIVEEEQGERTREIEMQVMDIVTINDMNGHAAIIESDHRP